MLNCLTLMLREESTKEKRIRWTPSRLCVATIKCVFQLIYWWQPKDDAFSFLLLILLASLTHFALFFARFDRVCGHARRHDVISLTLYSNIYNMNEHETKWNLIIWFLPTWRAKRVSRRMIYVRHVEVVFHRFDEKMRFFFIFTLTPFWVLTFTFYSIWMRMNAATPSPSSFV